MSIPAAPPLDRLDDATPHARWLSNGRYTVLATSAGTGRSQWDEFVLTSFRPDRVEDGGGLFVYLRDATTGALASLGHQPVVDPSIRRSAASRPGALALGLEWDGVEVTMEIAVAPDADVEQRRIVLVERAGRARSLEVTAAAELVLDRGPAFAAHPAFSKLFVQTQWDADREALFARRRPRAPGDRAPWMGASLRGPGVLAHETDRVRFLGRGRSLARPAAIAGPLSGTAGNVLEPVFALRRSLALAAGGRADLVLALAAGDTRDPVAAALARADAFEAAAAHERALLERLGLGEAAGAYLDDLLGAIVYAHPALRADAAVIARARGRLAMLWSDGLGGERPLVVVPIDGDLGFARELLVARTYWGAKATGPDVLLLTTGDAAGAQGLAAEANTAAGGRVVVWRREEQPAERIDVAHAWASAVLGKWPTLASDAPIAAAPRFRPAREEHAAPLATASLRFDNGAGGFADDGSYVVRVAGERPPMPWVNCLANELVGGLVSESGAAHTWSRNSREHRLTPWSNDPVADPHGEALYLRDEEAGVFWSPVPGPVGDGAPYEARHALGATTWRHASASLEQETTTFVPPVAPVKVTRVRLRNLAARPRRIGVFAYQRLVLGASAEESGRSIATSRERDVLLATNGLAGDFAGGVAFAAAVAPPGSELAATCDRAAFVGRNRSPANPRALAGDTTLDGRTGAALDACFAWQVTLDVPAHGEAECAFLLGEADGVAEAHALVDGMREAGAVARALEETAGAWRALADGVQIETPMPEIDLLVNGWLAVQTTACRLWGRTAFYQSGGAFGFRDQLQDAAAMIHLDAAFVRAQILRNAAHQFPEGDVLHWWHPPASKGTRTRFSDDLLWLPHMTGFYVHHTGDASVLDEVAGFRSARLLEADEDEAYLETTEAAETATVYEHCCRALDRSLTQGAHGLPLMGTGDWNDGMNRVGREGRGESVWVGFFLYATLPDWIEWAEQRGEPERAARYRAYQEQLRGALEAAWDGAWYRRAYYDDGTPLGSASSDECKIDAIAQSWAVISNAVPRDRASAAMDALEAHLVSQEDGLIRLLTPPFDRTTHEPGYIKGYVPGIRENGGQYTHGALWAVRACAELGRRDRAAAWLRMLTPVWHAERARLATYQVEPYVVAADIYGAAPHVGRGGWTWYTGSSGWMLRVAIESVLGVTIEGGDTLRIRPCVPDEWPGFKMRLRMPDGRTHVAIEVSNPDRCTAAVVSATLDGVASDAEALRIRLDGGLHRVAIGLGAAR